MSANPQSIISSRLHTNNVFKVDDTRKNTIKRVSHPIRILNNKYEEVGTKMENIPKQEEFKKRNSEQIDLDKKSCSFDDKILKTAPSSLFITLNRLMYSKNCVRFYIVLIVFSIFVLIYSIYGYFAKLSKRFLNLDELPIIICELVLTFIITLDIIVRIYTTVNI